MREQRLARKLIFSLYNTMVHYLILVIFVSTAAAGWLRRLRVLVLIPAQSVRTSAYVRNIRLKKLKTQQHTTYSKYTCSIQFLGVVCECVIIRFHVRLLCYFVRIADRAGRCNAAVVEYISLTPDPVPVCGGLPTSSNPALPCTRAMQQ